MECSPENENLTFTPKVAMLVNNSRKSAEDIADVASINSIGKVLTVKKDYKSRLLCLL